MANFCHEFFSSDHFYSIIQSNSRLTAIEQHMPHTVVRSVLYTISHASYINCAESRILLFIFCSCMPWYESLTQDVPPPSCAMETEYWFVQFLEACSLSLPKPQFRVSWKLPTSKVSRRLSPLDLSLQSK